MRHGRLGLLSALALTLSVFGCGGDGPECRIYLVHDTTGAFDGLYVVESPAGGVWGEDLLLGPEEYINSNWRVFHFEADKSYDLKLDYTLGSESRNLQSSNNVCNDGQGIKYDIDGGNFFTTYFTFED